VKSYHSLRRDRRLPCRRLHVAALATAGSVWLLGSAAHVAAAEADPTKTAPAKAAVAAFLDAVKRGDDATARGMLTTVARAKTEELGMSVAPPVADTATYAVRECEIVSDAGDVAHVATVWTDVAADGSQSSENVIWVVRLDPEGWRVVGMALRVFDDMPPLLLNFEDPDDMIAKQEMVATELERRSREPAQPQSPAARTADGQGQPAGARR
jgi:hypothetical protein